MIPVISVVGRKNAGKTTLMEGLIASLKSAGLRVAALKHDVHGFEMDHEGKDTYRFARAGADGVGICSADRFARIERIEREVSPEEFLRGLTVPPDFLLVEGFKRRFYPKVEVLRGGKPLFPRSPLLAATFGEPLADDAAPHFSSAEALASHLRDVFLSEEAREVSCAVLAGGRSRRFGSDKPRAELMGRTLLEWAARAVGPLFGDVFVVSRSPQRSGSLAALGVTWRPDLLEDTHSLGGIFSALKHARTDLVCVCPCDAPFIQPRLLRALVRAAEGRGAAACRRDGGVEPFPAVYRRTCLEPVETMLSEGRLRVSELFSAVDARLLSEDETRDLDPLGWSFRDLDTPEALTEAENILKSGEAVRA